MLNCKNRRMNSFGNIFRLTSFGESHGVAVGGVIDGCPSGLKIDIGAIQTELDRRKPGQSHITTPRKESDTVEFLSGVYGGVTTGTPIGFIIRNSNQHSADYNNLEQVFRPSHADYTYFSKYGVRDHRGGGRSSARETISRVVAGAVAKQVLNHYGISINAYVSQVADISLDKEYFDLDLSTIENNIVRCPDQDTASKMIAEIESAKRVNDSLGGIISAVATGVPVGLGVPVFNKLHADLGSAMLGINAVKGFDIGSGFKGAKMFGSDHNDSFTVSNGEVSTTTNNSGGVQGGISNGEDLFWRVAFKPIATLTRVQNTISKDKEEIEINLKGRHDPCVLPRAVPIVEAMAAIVLLDHILLDRVTKL